MSRVVTSRKPWTCDECGKEQESGSKKAIVRDGRWITLTSISPDDAQSQRSIHVDGDFTYCDACMARWRR